MEINTGSYITLESNEEMLRLVHYTLNDISQMMCINTLYYVESFDDDNTILMAIKTKTNDTYKYLEVPTSIVRECYMPVKVDGALKKYTDALMSKHIEEELEKDKKYGENVILVWKEKAKKWDNRGEGIAIECYRLVQQERDSAYKRIEELEQKNKVLVDGMMALSFLFTDLDFAMLETYIRNPKLLDRWLETGTITRDQYIKIKALLELLEDIV